MNFAKAIRYLLCSFFCFTVLSDIVKIKVLKTMRKKRAVMEWADRTKPEEADLIQDLNQIVKIPSILDSNTQTGAITIWNHYGAH